MRSNIGKYEKLDVRQEGRLALRLKPILQAAAHALFQCGNRNGCITAAKA